MKIQTPQPLVDCIRDTINNQYVYEKRQYLGASEIGHECHRYLWYSYNKGREKPEDTLAIQSGIHAENMMIDILKKVPSIKLVTKNKQGGQIGFSAIQGKFKGHLDGVIKGVPEAPKTVHVWEHKDCAQKNFNSFVKLVNRDVTTKSVLKEWNIKYYAQAQVYMHFSGFKRHLLTVSLAGLRDFAYCRTEYDKDFALRMVNKADTIINSHEPSPKISKTPDFFMCKMCPFRKECHNEEA